WFGSRRHSPTCGAAAPTARIGRPGTGCSPAATEPISAATRTARPMSRRLTPEIVLAICPLHPIVRRVERPWSAGRGWAADRGTAHRWPRGPGHVPRPPLPSPMRNTEPRITPQIAVKHLRQTQPSRPLGDRSKWKDHVMPLATPETYSAMLDRAKEGGFAYPAISVTSSVTINAALRGFAEAGSDGILQ